MKRYVAKAGAYSSSQAQGRSARVLDLVLIGADLYSENLLSTTASRQVRF